MKMNEIQSFSIDIHENVRAKRKKKIIWGNQVAKQENENDDAF